MSPGPIEDAPANPALASLSDHQRRQRSHGLVDRFLEVASRDRPLVIVIEDVHWIDTSSRDLLDALAERIDQRRCMLMMTTRHTEQPLHSETFLQLSPLSRNDCIELLRCTTESCELSDGDIETLVQRAGGNPFLLEELALAAVSGADPARELPGSVNAVERALIPFDFNDYLELVDWTGRAIREDKRGFIPTETPDGSDWRRAVSKRRRTAFRLTDSVFPRPLDPASEYEPCRFRRFYLDCNSSLPAFSRVEEACEFALCRWVSSHS